MRYDFESASIYTIFCQDYGYRVSLARNSINSSNYVYTCNYMLKVDENAKTYKFIKSRGTDKSENAILKELL